MACTNFHIYAAAIALINKNQPIDSQKGTMLIILDSRSSLDHL